MAKEKKEEVQVIASIASIEFKTEALMNSLEISLLEEISKAEEHGATALQLRNVLQLISNAKRSYEQYLRSK